MKKSTLFAGGLFAGLVLSQTWRSLTKAGIKFGIKASHKALEFSQQAMEDIGDLAAEATDELRAEATSRPYQAASEVRFEQEIN